MLKELGRGASYGVPDPGRRKDWVFQLAAGACRFPVVTYGTSPLGFLSLYQEWLLNFVK